MRGDTGARAMIDQICDAEKLAALETIAGSLADEIGNPLAGVLGLLQVAERRTREPETRNRLAHVQSELLRVVRILRELTDCTRARHDDAVVDVNAAVTSATTFARYVCSTVPIAVFQTLDPQVPALAGNRGRFFQACVHLLMSAYEAKPGPDQSVAVTTRREEGAIVLRVEDRCPGTTPGVRSPTVAPAGSGLFACRGIFVDEFGARFVVDSTAGGGTRVTVTLPIDRRERADGP